MMGWIVPFVILPVLGLVTFAVFRAQVVTDRDVQWLAGGFVARADEERVYRRYLLRHRRHRVVGGAFGASVALVVGGRWYGQVTVGVGNGSPLGDLLLCTLTGVVVGALSAESFRLSQPRSAARAASLGPRAGLPLVLVARAAMVLAAASLVVALVVVMQGGATWSVLAAVIGCVVVLVGQATRAAIAGRARPVLTARAAHVDARMRAFAAESVSWLQLAAAVLTAAWVLSGLDADGPLVTLAVVSGLVLAIVLLVRAKPHPRRSWQPAA